MMICPKEFNCPFVKNTVGRICVISWGDLSENRCQYITADIFGPPVNRRAAFFMPKYLVFISVRPKTGIYAFPFSLFLPVKNRF